MAQTPRRLSPYDSLLDFFGAELRHWRELRELSQDTLGRLVHASGDTLGKVEKATRWPTRILAESCDRALDTGGILTRLWPLVDLERRGSRSGERGTVPTIGPTIPGGRPVVLHVDEEDNVWAQWDRRKFLVATGLIVGLGGDRSASPLDDPFGFASTVGTQWPDTRLSRPVPSYGVDWTMIFPGGRSLLGGEAALQLHPVQVEAERAVMSVPRSTRTQEFLRRPGRRLIVGAWDGADGPRFLLLDSKVAHRVSQSGSSVYNLIVPTAYELDNLTFGILWAAVNLDDALSADDYALTEALNDLKAYEQLSSSAVSKEAAPGLNAVAHMWLGSEFCARHILRALPSLPQFPAFWTREQRGEEAISWLFFDHKYEYLRSMALLDGSASRGFCIPESAVIDSPAYERTMLFLVAALMESLRIRVEITADPEYSEAEGFVVAANRQAIIANWVRGDGIWHVDCAAGRSKVREFTEVSADVGAHSVIDAPTSAGRLRRLASYLSLDWAWLLRRCSALARCETSRLIQVRSGNLSLAGLDAACTFVATLHTELI